MTGGTNFTYQRDVSPAERWFIARDALRPPTVIQLVVEGVGNPNPDNLRDALQHTAIANPGSSLVLSESENGLQWRIGPTPALTVVDAPEFEALDDHNANFLHTPYNARTGPTCGLFLVHGKTNTYLIFRALHAVMDGQGVRRWAQDFMRCLRHETPEGNPSTFTMSELAKELAVPRRAQPLRDALHPFGPAVPPGGKGRFHWKRLTNLRPLHVKDSARIAIALADHARARESGTFRLAVPADLRHYHPDERTTANFFGSLHIDVPEGADPDNVALRIVHAMYTHEALKPIGLFASDQAASLAVMQVAHYYDLARQDDTGRYAFSATLSNLGVMNGVDYSAPDFSARSAFFVPLEGDLGCAVSVNGFDGHTEVAVGLSNRFASAGNLDVFAQLMRNALGASNSATTFTEPPPEIATAAQNA